MNSACDIRKKIFCFTYAGGTAAFFDQIEKDLPGYELIKLDYSGHGTRHQEPYYESFKELADDLYDRIKDSLDGKYALFGYSMGSIGAVEILDRIIRDGKNEPTTVFLAAHEPHTKSELLDYDGDEADEWVKRRTMEFGGIPEKLTKNIAFWRTYLPVYRADYSIIGSYEFEKLCLHTDIPATVFYSETDTAFCEMEQWKDYFVGEVDFHEFAGNHFFIQEYHKEMAEIISKRMEMGNDI